MTPTDEVLRDLSDAQERIRERAADALAFAEKHNFHIETLMFERDRYAKAGSLRTTFGADDEYSLRCRALAIARARRDRLQRRRAS